MKPLVCIFAHPDDESFGPGGSIAKFAKQRDVYLLCVTDGDGGGDKKLGEIRKKELQSAAQVLGVKGVEFLGYADGTLNNNLYHQLAADIQQKLEEYQPETIMTFDLKGVSGHIDHVAVALVTTFVFKKLTFVKELLYYCQLEEMMSQIKDYFVYIPPAYSQDEVDLVIDVSKYWQTKLKAMKEHKSQQKDIDFIIPLIEKLPKEEYFTILYH